MNTISLSISGTASFYDTAYRPNAAPPENRPCPDSSERTKGPDRSRENTPDRSGEPDSPKKDSPDAKSERAPSTPIR